MTWFHEQCLDDPVEQEAHPHSTHAYGKDVAKLLHDVPICRGSNGVEDRDADWHVAGTGRRLKKLREWVRNKTLSDEWKAVLGSSFVQEMLDSNWAFYQCPSCDSYI
jgi:hypothetical protein